MAGTMTEISWYVLKFFCRDFLFSSCVIGTVVPDRATPQTGSRAKTHPQRLFMWCRNIGMERTARRLNAGSKSVIHIARKRETEPSEWCVRFWVFLHMMSYIDHFGNRRKMQLRFTIAMQRDMWISPPIGWNVRRTWPVQILAALKARL